MKAHEILIIAALLGALGVAAGAFGAHVLERTLDARALGLWHTGSHYLQLHAVVLVAIAALAQHDASRAITWSAGLIGVGVFVFSGTLYALALGGPRILGAITPLGGSSLIAGWLALVVHGLLRWR